MAATQPQPTQHCYSGVCCYACSFRCAPLNCYRSGTRPGPSVGLQTAAALPNSNPLAPGARVSAAHHCKVLRVVQLHSAPNTLNISLGFRDTRPDADSEALGCLDDSWVAFEYNNILLSTVSQLPWACWVLLQNPSQIRTPVWYHV